MSKFWGERSVELDLDCEVRLWLSVMAYNLRNLWRRLVLPKRLTTGR